MPEESGGDSCYVFDCNNYGGKFVAYKDQTD